ncbi:MAG TPA: SIR2 family protein [Allosphingosinicella sp.]|jgi:tetratricopeptide (TPR) repeat protein
MTEVAHDQLYEAVNTGRLVAFVGLGLSLAYGNFTWHEFISAVIGQLKKELEKYEADDSNLPATMRVKAQLHLLEGDHYRDGIVVLELVRRAFRLIDDRKGLEHGTSYRETLTELFSSDQAFVRRLLRKRLEQAGAEELIEELEELEKLEKLETPGDKDFYSLTSRLYSLPTLTSLAALADPALKLEDLLQKLRKEPRRQRDRGDFLPLDRRSPLSLFLAGARLNGPISLKLEEQEGCTPLRPLLDPLRELALDLGVKRYFTTNYDLEIENLFMFDDLREQPRAPVFPHLLRRLVRSGIVETGLNGAALFRWRSDGTMVRSDVNDGINTAPLVEFAIGGRKNVVQIYHHHGRVDLPDTMIAADGEYNRMYRAQGRNRPSLDRAYDVMIEGNPILFVGSGLSEAELTRTFRERISNPRERGRSPVFNLTPALQGAKGLLEEELNSYTKLGVHVFQYGHPRRGRRYTLRRHLILVDAIAKKFDLGSRHGWRSPLADFPPSDESEELGASDLPTSEGDLRDEYRLIHDLDFDRHAVAWLCGPGGKALADKVLGTGGGRGEAANLVADYLKMLSGKLLTASLRHEIRQIGREAKLFFHRHAQRIEPRALPASDGNLLTRHLAVPAAALPADARKWQFSLAGDGSAQAGTGPDYESLLRLLRNDRGNDKIVIAGERGCGRGSLLKQLAHDLEGTGRKTLIANCCFGQEVDSVISLISGLVSASPAPAPVSRRERLTQAAGPPPAIILGAVDRLFGPDHLPMGAEFHEVLRLMLRQDFPATIVLIATPSCLPFFEKIKPHPPLIWSLASETGPDARPSGYLRLLHNQWSKRHQDHAQTDPQSAKIAMTGESRRADLIVGREIHALEETKHAIGRLTQEMMKTLAFIGLPVEAEVLICAPEIRRLLAAASGKPAEGPAPSGRSQLEDESTRGAFIKALQLGVASNLISIIEPYRSQPSADAAVAKGDLTAAIRRRCRFALHRWGSQVVRERFGVPQSETVLSDCFNLSLYSAQPDDAPAADPRVTQAIEQLVDHLLNAWRDVSLREDLQDGIHSLRRDLLEENTFSTEPLVSELLNRLRHTERQLRSLDPLVPSALRAVGGVIRGFFSSANLLGLDSGDPGSRGDGAVITIHKQRIRRLLDFAIEAQGIRACLDRGGDALKKQLTDDLLCLDVLATAEEKAGSGSTSQRQPLANEKLRIFEGWELGGEPVEQRLEKIIGDVMIGVAPAAGTPEKQLLQPAYRRLSESLAADDEPHERAAALGLRPFYEEEIVWLLNERAMLSLAQGDLYTATTTLRLAMEANEPLEGTGYGPNRRRMLVNQAVLWIERGKIAEARRSLEKLLVNLPERVGHEPTPYEDRLISALARGYLGLCDQLHGLAAIAEQRFDAALAELNELRELRAVAMFEMHRGSLLQCVESRWDEAATSLAHAVEAAEGGRHTDILYRVRIAQVHNDYARKKIEGPEALRVLRAAIDYADEFEMYRVGIDALRASTHLRLKLGDIETASVDCARALALATQHGMSLRRIYLRVMTGKVYVARGDHGNARFIFERAIEAAERVGYQRAIETASRQLMNLPRG